MQVRLMPETEAKISELARRTGRSADELIEEAVGHLVSYNEWLERKVRDSQAAVGYEDTISDGDVRAWLDARKRR